MPIRSLELLGTVAQGFGDLLKNVVFLGGPTLDLYVSDSAAIQNRTTGEIDCILGSLALPDYAQWEQLLLERGFHKLTAIDQFRHRWQYDGITLNILARDKDRLAVNYRWFDEGIFHAQSFSLPNGLSIKTFSPAYFIAAKIEAFIHQGERDYRTSEDFEDLIFVLDNREAITKDMCQAFYEVRQYIQSHFNRFLNDPCLEEGLYYVLPFGVDFSHIQRIFNIMLSVVNYEPNLVRSK